MSPEQSLESHQPRPAELIPPEPLEYATPELIRELGTGRPAIEAVDSFCFGILAGGVAFAAFGSVGLAGGEVAGAVCALAGLTVVATVCGTLLFGWVISMSEIWSGRALIRRAGRIVFASGAAYVPAIGITAIFETRQSSATFPLLVLAAAILFPMLAPVWLTRRSGKPFD